MNSEINELTNKLVLLEHLNKNNEDAELITFKKMGEEAKKYLMAHPWCNPDHKIYFGNGVADIIATFLFVFSKKIGGTDEALWVVVGDLPSAYLVTDHATNSNDAINVYCKLMGSWVTAVLNGHDLSTVFPVNAKPTKENALKLASRINFIKHNIIPVL